MGCISSSPKAEGGSTSDSPLHQTKKKDDKPVVVCDVGGGSLVIYVEGKKVASPAYANNEYETFAAKEGEWNSGPLLMLMQKSLGPALRSHPALKGRAYRVKIGITGSARVDHTPEDLKKRLDQIHELYSQSAGSTFGALECGILSHELEAELEQQSIFFILQQVEA